MMEQPKLGQLLKGGEGRDAVHVAIVPVVAEHDMLPGDKIGFTRSIDTGLVGSYRVNEHVKEIGVADPYLEGTIHAGDRFYMFLFPGTVTSLRHVWTHPAFEDEAGAERLSEQTKTDSEQWLRNFCSSNDCPDYKTMIEMVSDAIRNGGKSTVQEHTEWGDYGFVEFKDYGDGDEYLYFCGLDSHSVIPDEFWTHFENVTGLTPPSRPTSFSCSC